jgi:hypothetical protein
MIVNDVISQGRAAISERWEIHQKNLTTAEAYYHEGVFKA